MKKYLLIGAVILISALVIFSALQTRKNLTQNLPQTRTEIAPIAVQTISPGQAKTTVSERTFPATITTEGEAKIIAKVSGTVIADNLTLGSTVGTGKTLYRIDETGGVISSETGFKSASLLQAKLALKNAEESYQQAKREYEKNKSQALKTARDIQKNLRDIALSNYNALLDAYSIKSPITGIVTMKSVSIGNTVTPGTPLATISAGKKVARFYVSAEDLPLFSLKQSVSLSLQNTSIPGVVSRISPVAESVSKRFLIEVTGTDKTFQNIPSETIATLAVTLRRDAKENTLLLPLSALLQEQNGSFVFVADNDVAKKQEVRIEAIYGETVEISGDFTPQTQFITTNAKRLTDGAEITIH